jgi:hypothetical protein
MRRLKFLIVIFLGVFMTSMTGSLNAQDNKKIDFKAKWKNDSTKNVISISIVNSDFPLNCYIYDSSPFTGGILIKQIDNIYSNEIDIEMIEKKKVYICIYKNENNLAAKWLRISE